MSVATTFLGQGFLAQAQPGATVSTGEAVAFWILGPLALLGALRMVFARNAVHSALWLVLTMLSLGLLYMVQNAPFLGFTQIIVYAGAIMMLFLFVLMMVGRESSDSVVEVLRGQRVAAAVAGIGFAGLLVSGLARALANVQSAPPLNPWTPQGGGAGGLGRLIFTDYLFPFELTSALLITAALGAMVLAYGGKGRGVRRTQKEMATERFRGARPSPMPGPGVYATADSVATPALLPDGSVAPDSLSELLENLPAERLGKDRTAVSGKGPEPSPHALTGGHREKEADMPRARDVSAPPRTNGSHHAENGDQAEGNASGKVTDGNNSAQPSSEEVRQ